MLVSVICSDTRDQAEVCLTWWPGRPCGWSRSVLLTESTWKSTVHTATDCEGQGSCFCIVINDSKCMHNWEEEHKRLLWQPSLHPPWLSLHPPSILQHSTPVQKNEERKTSKRAKNKQINEQYGEVEVSTVPQLMASDKGSGREKLSVPWWGGH